MSPTRLRLAQLMNQVTSRAASAQVEPVARSVGRGYVASFDAGARKAAIREGTQDAEPTPGFDVPAFLELAVNDYVLYRKLGSDRVVLAAIDRNAVVSTGGGGGGGGPTIAVDVSIADGGDHFTSTDVEGALAELFTDLGAYQPLDSDLTAIAALSTTSFGRSVLIQADAAALRTLAGLGSLATLSSLAHSATTGQTANDHHNEIHVLATDTALGADHTISGGVAGYVLRALTATTAKFMQLLHSDLGSVGANDHHNQAHSISGADHTGSVAAAQMPALTGDVTSSAGAVATTLANAGPGATGPLGGATVAPIVTIDAKGRVTGLSSETITGVVPSAHASSHNAGGSDAISIDATAATGSLRTLGTGSAQAAAGNDSRLSDSRAPSGAAGGALGGTYPNPTLVLYTAAFTFADTDVTSSGALNTTKDYIANPSADNFWGSMPYAGTVLAIGVHINSARTGGMITFRVRNATTAAFIGPTAQIDGTNTTKHSATGLPGAAGNTFSAGDVLGVRSTVTVATFAPITADVTLFILVAFTGP